MLFQPNNNLLGFTGTRRLPSRVSPETGSVQLVNKTKQNWKYNSRRNIIEFNKRYNYVEMYNDEFGFPLAATP